MSNPKQEQRLAAVAALRRVLGILRADRRAMRERAIAEILLALNRYDTFRERALRAKRGHRGRDHMQLERAAWICSELSRRSSGFNSTAICSRWTVGARTAYRDIAYLRTRGAPIVYDPRTREFSFARPWRLDGPLE